MNSGEGENVLASMPTSKSGKANKAMVENEAGEFR